MGWSQATLSIELGATAGDLGCDTDEGGPGVGGADRFYPGSSPQIRLTGTIPAQDGGTSLALSFERFAAGRDFNLSIDLDALGKDGGRTWVLPSDMKGGRVLATYTGPSGGPKKIDAVFDERAEADSGAGGCV